MPRRRYPKQEAKICVRKRGRLYCKPIKIERGVWKGHLSSVAACVRRGEELIHKEGRDYAEVINQLNLLRVWNKNRDPSFCRMLTKCMREIAKREGKRGRIKDIC